MRAGKRRLVRLAGGLAAVALTATSAAALGAVPASAAPSGAPAAPAQLNWKPCSQLQVSPMVARQAAQNTQQQVRFECANVRVPLDYDNPGGKKIEIAVSRLATATPEDRRGVLLLNPGGPGGSGLIMPLLIAALAPDSLLDHYDLIGFDPRGVGQSAPVTCKLTRSQLSKVFPPWPLDGGVEANAEVARQVAQQCVKYSPEVLPHVTTANTARDMDRIRAALGEDKISYLGYSYGTELGAVYASLFPSRTDRVVLDSSVSPNRIWRETLLAWGPATEIRFPDFAEFAAARDGAYGLGSTPAQVRELYFTLASQLDKNPLETPTGSINGNDFRGITRGSLYSNAAFPSLAKFWQMVKRSDGDAAAQAARAARLRTVPLRQSSAATLIGIFCNDAAWPRSVQTYKQDVARYRQRYPLAGAMAANIFPCAFWPREWVQRPVDVTSQGPSNILIVQNLRDPATPYKGALGMRANLGDRASLVTVDEGGHGVYLIEQNPCALNTATQFLVNGKFPSDDVYCGLSTTRTGPRTLSADERERIVAEIRSRMFPL